MLLNLCLFVTPQSYQQESGQFFLESHFQVLQQGIWLWPLLPASCDWFSLRCLLPCMPLQPGLQGCASFALHQEIVQTLGISKLGIVCICTIWKAVTAHLVIFSVFSGKYLLADLSMAPAETEAK